MANIEMNTINIKDAGGNIKKLSVDYKNAIDEIFYKLKNLDNFNVWTGDNVNSSVKVYMDAVVKEQNMYNEYANCLDSYGNILVEYAEEINNITNNRVK